MTGRITVSESEHHLLARFTRPEARNAIDLDFISELHALCDRLEREPKVLVLTGSEGFFAAGADIRQLRERGPVEALTGINSRAFDRVARLPFPTIALVNGPAFGGGAELAYACDLRIATPAAKFGNPEPNLGIIAGAGASWRLRELVGLGMASDVLLLGRVLDAQEALAAGLVTRIVEEEAADELLADLAAKVDSAAPLAIRMTKLALHAPAVAHPVVDDIVQSALFQTDEKHARMDAFLTKKKS
jgi:enoyl-CoA hydratase